MPLRRPIEQRRARAGSWGSRASTGALRFTGDGLNRRQRPLGRRPEFGGEGRRGYGAWQEQQVRVLGSWRCTEHDGVLGCGWLGPWPRWRHGHRRVRPSPVKRRAPVDARKHQLLGDGLRGPFGRRRRNPAGRHRVWPRQRRVAGGVSPG